jgi:hypothetical protein
MRIFQRWYFGLCWNLRLVKRVIISWKIFGFFLRIFWRLYFDMVKYLSFLNSSFALRYFLINVNGKAAVWHTPPCSIKGGLWALLCCSYGVLEDLQLWSASEWTSSLLLLMNKMTDHPRTDFRTDGHIPNPRNSRIPCTCTPGACRVTSCRHPRLQHHPSSSSSL